jgi:hypothetical protein
MKNSTKQPEPVHTIPITFSRYGKKFTLDVKIFTTDKELNKYYRSVVKPTKIDKSGVYAAAIFENPCRVNHNTIGELVFSLEFLHPSLIAHEAVHMVFNYYENTHGLDFTTRRREESFCSILETIMDGIYRYIDKHKIPYHPVPSYRR